jgi:hypothetical protein
MSVSLILGPNGQIDPQFIPVAVGPTGATGPQGPAGAASDTGATGPTGDIGLWSTVPATTNVDLAGFGIDNGGGATFSATVSALEFSAPTVTTDRIISSLNPSVEIGNDLDFVNAQSLLNVLNLNGVPVADIISPQAGQYYKTTAQNLTTVASPAFTTITFQGDSYQGTAITRVGGTSTFQFQVNTSGVYSLEGQISVISFLNTTLADPSVRLSFNITRGAQTNAVITNQFEIPNNIPNNPSLDIGGTYQLVAGDLLVFQVVYYLNAAQTLVIGGQSAAPNDWDYNTFWSWQLIKPLP